jgi:hypothetical protein
MIVTAGAILLLGHSMHAMMGAPAGSRDAAEARA